MGSFRNPPLTLSSSLRGFIHFVQDEGFDFDAHVARLMEASARETGLRQRTKDDNLQTKGLARLRREGDDDSDSNSDAGGERSIADSNASSGEFDESLLEGLDLSGGARVGEGPGAAEDRAVLDSQFESVSAFVVAVVSGEGGG